MTPLAGVFPVICPDEEAGAGLDAFEGPFDLLLTILLSEELEPREPRASTRQFAR